MRTAKIEFPGLVEQAKCQQRLFEAGQGLGTFLVGAVDVLARGLVRSAFGLSLSELYDVVVSALLGVY